MKKPKIVQITCLLLLAGTLHVRAQITWGPPVNIGSAGASDVSTVGTLNYAYDWGNSSPTINGVAFTEVASDAGNANVTISGIAGGVDHTGEGTGAAGSPYYALSTSVTTYVPLIQGTAYGGTGAGTITLNGLTSGHNYLVQVWFNDSRGGGESGRNETLSSLSGNSVTLAHYVGGNLNQASSAGGLGQYSIGKFTATGTSQAFTVTPGGVNPGSQFNSIQVRDITSAVSGASSGTWNMTTSGGLWGTAGNWAGSIVAGGSTATANFANLALVTDPTVVHLDAADTIGNLIFGDINPSTAAGWSLDNNAASADTLTLAGSTPTITVNPLGTGKAAAISAVVAGSAGLVKAGAGQLTLNGAAVNTYAGSTAINDGTLLADFSNISPTTTPNLINSGSALALGGGTFQINGNATSASSQTVNGTTVTAGANVISVGGSISPTLALGALYQYVGTTLEFVGPATIGSGNASVAATGQITTTTQNGVASDLGLMWGPGRSAPATVGLYDWASTYTTAGTSSSSPYTVIGGSQVSGFYVTLASGALANGDDNVDITGSANASGATQYADTIRFNTPAAINFLVGGGHGFLTSGVLVTPNVGANNITISPATGGLIAANNPGNTTQAGLNIYQNNISGELLITAPIGDYGGTARTTDYVQAGSGTVVLSGVNTYSQATYLDGGDTVVAADSGFGAVANGSPVILNGGTAVGDANFTMYNGSTIKRPFVIGANGGGLAAISGYAMTINGVIGGAFESGPLTIGIPASSANGSVTGLLPGTGGSSPNTAAYATGTVGLSGANTYVGGTVLQSGTVNINGINALGGANYGGVTFNGGNLQYAIGFSGNGSGDLTSIGSAGVSLAAGGGTIDVNGNNLTYAGSIGNSGSGPFTLVDSTGGGSLTLSGGGTYTGATTVGNGTTAVTLNVNGTLASSSVTVTNQGTFGGTGTIAGSVTWLTGAAGAFTSGSPLTVGGAVTLNGNSMKVNVPGVTPLAIGSYTLLNATNGITGSFNTSSTTYSGAGAAIGTVSSISTTSTNVVLVVASGGALATWTNNVSGNWSGGTNWSSNPNVPHSPGDNATLGVGSAFQTVTLDTNETVGGIQFTNANSFAVASSGHALKLDNSGFGASLTVSAGTSNAIQTSVALNDNTTVTVGGGNSLAISGIISNSPSVTKTLTVNGAGTTILSGANTYGPAAGTVGTTFSGGGTLQVGSNSALGAGDVSVTASGTLQAGAAISLLGNNIDIAPTVTVTANNNGNNLVLNGAINGSGAMTAIGGGTLTLGGNNNVTGSLTVNAGELSISSAANVRSSYIVLNGGGLLGTGSFYTSNNIGVGPAGGMTPGTAFIDAASGQTFELDGVIASAGNTGANNLLVNSLAASPGLVILGGANTFSGTTTIYTNTALALDNPLALQDSTLNYSSGTLIFTNITAASLGGLTGTTNLILTNAAGAALALTVGNNNGNASYTGTLSGSGSLTKTGTGTQTIGSPTGGGAAYTGQTLIYGGTVVLDGNGTVSMNAGANNIYLDASLGVSSLNLVDSAAVTTSGGVYLASEPVGGSGGGNVECGNVEYRQRFPCARWLLSDGDQ